MFVIYCSSLFTFYLRGGNHCHLPQILGYKPGLPTYIFSVTGWLGLVAIMESSCLTVPWSGVLWLKYICFHLLIEDVYIQIYPLSNSPFAIHVHAYPVILLIPTMITAIMTATTTPPMTQTIKEIMELSDL